MHAHKRLVSHVLDSSPDLHRDHFLRTMCVTAWSGIVPGEKKSHLEERARVKKPLGRRVALHTLRGPSARGPCR